MYAFVPQNVFDAIFILSRLNFRRTILKSGVHFKGQKKQLIMSSTASTIREYRVTYPFSVDEFKAGYLHTLHAVSKRETGGGE